LSFSALTIVGTWAVTGYPRISVEWEIQPDAQPDTPTYTASGGNLFPTFLDCSTTSGNATISCSMIAPFPENLLVTTEGIFLTVSSGSLVFTIVPNAAASSYDGTFSGIFSVTGATSAGAVQSFSGPVSGNYSRAP